MKIFRNWIADLVVGLCYIIAYGVITPATFLVHLFGNIANWIAVEA